jgi:hypothetical protein
MAVYGGFQPWKTVQSARLYQIAANYTTPIYKGEPVCRDATGYAVQWATTVALLGVALAFFDVNMNPLKYWGAETTATKGYVLVADDPNQEFVVAEDADTTPLAQADVFLNVEVALGTASTATGFAAATIDSTTKNTDATYAFRLVALAPIVGNTIYNATTCPNPKWVVVPNIHQLKDTTGL